MGKSLRNGKVLRKKKDISGVDFCCLRHKTLINLYNLSFPCVFYVTVQIYKAFVYEYIHRGTRDECLTVSIIVVKNVKTSEAPDQTFFPPLTQSGVSEELYEADTPGPVCICYTLLLILALAYVQAFIFDRPYYLILQFHCFRCNAEYHLEIFFV